MRLAAALLLFSVAVAPRMSAQTWDTSGNSQLNGTYYFRQVMWFIGDSSGDLADALSLYGNITFDGNGNYTISNFNGVDEAGNSVTVNTMGTYSIAASGYGFLSHPIATGDEIYGLVSNGIFIGSSTETVNGYNDLFIASQLASPAPGNSLFNGAYTLMQVDSPTLSVVDVRESRVQLTADGSGNIGSAHASGYIAGNGTTATNQSFSGVKYFFSNGAANVNFGGSLTQSNYDSILFAGTKYLYFSPDGNFVFGGDPQAWDMFVGVRSGTGSPNFSGTYYQGGLYQDDSEFANGYAPLNTYYGSLKTLSGGTLLGHQRILSDLGAGAIDYTYSGAYSLNSNGTYDDGNFNYVFGNGGALRVGLGDPPSIGINVAIQGPTFTPSGVYIDPTGVVNAASSSMFTAGVAPGEFITIYGSNLASTTQADGSFPTNLGGVQVMVNNRPAPVYLVSPNQISAVIPFETTETIASIQVIDNNIPSNTVPSFVNLTAPGVFTIPSGGLGSAAALHADYSLISASSPAQIGETISVYLTGLGAVSPAVADGTPGPSTPPYSTATNTIDVYVDNVQATTTFVGLAPDLIGLYQINFAIPSGVSNGYVNLDIAGPDAYASEALLPVGAVSGSARKAPGQPKAERSNFGRAKIKTRP
ncbi:MAG: IPT/TIG domain-containing protein [Bryobacteraceae bacterium]